jgi:Ca2+-binding RTX toxin-like protein
MFSVRQMALPAALATAVLLVFGVTSSAASNPWPTCLGKPATIVGTDGNDTLTGTDGNDVIAGLGGDDVITSGGSDEWDLICGGDGNDVVIVTGGGGLFDFGGAVVSGDAGDDRIQNSSDNLVIADYESSPEPVTADLGAGTESGWGTDTLVNVDAVDASPFDDTLTGSNTSNAFWGEAGNDTISGRAGADFIDGELGNDTIDGGSGRDWLDYFDAPAGVRVSLAKGTATGGAGADTFRSIEAVFGSEHADTLIGGPRSDRLEGSRGNDRLYGGGGKDTLLGESGRDRADGGPARDICRAERMVQCP